MSAKKTKIIITGGSGFIGSCLASFLSETYQITSIDKKRKSQFSGKSLNHIKVDLKNKAKLYRIINTIKPDHIIQLGMYTYMLEGTQGVLPKRFTIVLKDMISKDVQVNQVNEFFKTHRENYEEFVNGEIDKTEPEKCLMAFKMNNFSGFFLFLGILSKNL